MTIAVYGASGYQGKLVVAELARRGIDMVLMGRSPDRLRVAADQAGVPDAETRAAGLDDVERLTASLRGCAALINCAGPFTRSGEAPARAAIAAGCHYADTSGEQLHIKQIFDTLTADAERGGVTVVPAATDGGVPGDLIAHLLAERVEPVEEITTAHRIVGGGGMSRGSLRSLAEIADTIGGGGLGYEDGDWCSGTPGRRTSMRFPGSAEDVPVESFPLQEVITVPLHVRVRRVEGVADSALLARLTSAVDPALIDRMPEGPPEESRRAQEFTIVVDAVGRDGRSARGVVTGPDTYGTTAVIAVEAARRLATGSAEPGVLAPAQAFDPTDFLDFLAPHGITWNIDTHDRPTLDA
ncbi:MAG: saccharopine dehydrogenase family protein [Actinoallomurus sp.]